MTIVDELEQVEEYIDDLENEVRALREALRRSTKERDGALLDLREFKLCYLYSP